MTITKYIKAFFQQTFGKKVVKPDTGVKTEKFVFDDIAAYFSKIDTPAFQRISEKTCEDLDYDEVFMLLDRTHSKIGQQYFYQQLRTIPSNTSVACQNEALIQHLIQTPNETEKLKEALLPLDHFSAYEIHSLFQNTLPNKPDWLQWAWALGLLGITSLITSFFQPIFLVVFVPVILLNSIVHFKNKRQMDEYTTSFNQLKPLTLVANYLYNTHPKTQALQNDLPKALKSISSLKGYLGWYKAEQQLQGDIQILLWVTLEFLKVISLAEPIMHHTFIQKLKNRTNELKQLFEFVGKVDMLQNVAQIRTEFNTCIPNNNPTNSLTFTDAYHPLLFENRIGNSINTEQKSVLITGSNMSGKTTFMRTIGINCILGQTINLCFASGANIPKIKVYSAMRISDDLLNNKSYYQQEVDNLKYFIEQGALHDKCLFLLDEIYKGTNTQERIAAGYAVLDELAQHQNIVFVATHDLELTELLHTSYQMYHFSEQISNDSLDFDYLIKKGSLTQRNAIKILEISGYPVRVIEKARSL